MAFDHILNVVQFECGHCWLQCLVPREDSLHNFLLYIQIQMSSEFQLCWIKSCVFSGVDKNYYLFLIMPQKPEMSLALWAAMAQRNFTMMYILPKSVCTPCILLTCCPWFCCVCNPVSVFIQTYKGNILCKRFAYYHF